MLGYEPPDESDWETGLHPMDDLLRGERLPHIWCQGCGLGTALTTFISALQWLVEKYSPEFMEEGKKYIEENKKASKVIKIAVDHISGKARR